MNKDPHKQNKHFWSDPPPKRTYIILARSLMCHLNVNVPETVLPPKKHKQNKHFWSDPPPKRAYIILDPLFNCS